MAGQSVLVATVERKRDGGAVAMVVPDSLAGRLSDWIEQPWLDIVWQGFVVIVAIGLAAVLISYGTVGVVLGFLILAFFFREPIQDALADIWERNFWRPK